MKNRKSFRMNFLLLMMFAVVTACQKDKPLPCISECSDNYCVDFPELWSSWFEEHRFQYKSPCYNPLNSNEFVYYYKDNELGVFQLVKYNVVSNQKLILVNDVKIHGQPRWGRNGWIAFTRQPASYVEHIFIIRENGDSLTQITSSTANLSPFWNENGDDLYWTHSPDLGSQWYLLRKNRHTLNEDTVSNLSGFHNIDVLNDKLLHISNIESGGFNGHPTFYGYHILSSPPFTYNNFNVIGNAKNSATSGISWHPSGLYFYVTHSNGDGRGLYRINLNGGMAQLIKHCDNKRYSIVSCSSDGKNVIAERVSSFLEFDNDNNATGKIIEKSSIYLIDLLTLQETKIDLE